MTASTPPTNPKVITKNREHEYEAPARWRRPEHATAAAAQSTATASSAQSAPQRTVAQTVGSTSFLGAQLAADSAFVPPDSMGAVGPTQFLVAVNGRVRTFSKTGVADGVLDTTLNNFFGSVGGNTQGTTDPRVRYDRRSGRWFMTAITTPDAVVNNDILLGVSSSSTITGSTTWRTFAIPADSNTFADFDTLGVDEDALYIGANVFDDTGALLDVSGWVVTKSSVLGTGSIHVTEFPSLMDFDNGIGPYSPEGVDNFDAGTNQGYFIGIDAFGPDQLDVVRVNNPASTTPTIGMPIAVPTAATTIPDPVAQPSPGPTLDGSDLPRLGNAVIRKGRLWTSHSMDMKADGTLSSDPIGAPGGREGIRWYELKNLTATPAVNQSGLVYDSSTTSPFSYWMSSIMVSGQGNTAMGFSRASTDATNGFASAAITGRLPGDAANAMDAVTLVQGSSSTYAPTGDTPERWGDYSYTSVDPADDMTMWTIQEYAPTTDRWGVRVVQLRAPAPTFTAASGAPVGATNTPIAITGTGFFDPGTGFPNRLHATATGGVTVNSVASVSPTKVVLNVSTVAASAGDVTVTVTNPDGQTAAGTATLSSATLCAVASCSDFNNDGKPDAFWRNKKTGADSVWYLNGAQLVSAATMPTAGADWIPVHGADFNGGGKPDIFWHNRSSGANSIWIMNGTTRTSSLAVNKSVTGAWVPEVAADFNADTHPDILWHNTSTGANSVWLMNGGTVTSFVKLSKNPAAEWVPFAAKDANGNSKPDIYWFNTKTGASSIWFMNGTTYAGSVAVNHKVSLAYEPAMVEDLDADSSPDIVWHNKSTGQLSAWFMNGGALQTFATIGTASTDWKPY